MDIIGGKINQEDGGESCRNGLGYGGRILIFGKRGGQRV